MNCLQCDSSNATLKHRWSGWRAFDPGPTLPVNSDKAWQFFCNTECLDKHLKNRNYFLENVLDQTMNSCAYFKREGHSMKGKYEREGKLVPVSAYWFSYDIECGDVEYFRKYEKMNNDTENIGSTLADFYKFISVNDWVKDWFKPRKDPPYT